MPALELLDIRLFGGNVAFPRCWANPDPCGKKAPKGKSFLLLYLNMSI